MWLAYSTIWYYFLLFFHATSLLFLAILFQKMDENTDIKGNKINEIRKIGKSAW